MPEGAAWVRIVGDGLAVQGACTLVGLVWRCDKNDEECHIYDGLDATSGKPFVKLVGDADSILPINLGDGVAFDTGIYIDQTTTKDEVTLLVR